MTANARITDLTHRDAPWAGLRTLVTGLGVSGFAAADALLQRGATVVVLDRGIGSAAQAEHIQILSARGADVRVGPEHVRRWPTHEGAAGVHEHEFDIVVTSPGWSPSQPILADAGARDIPVWGEVELAWRMRPRHGAAPWLCITGTNGKTTTVLMVEAMLRAAGSRAMAVGNVGTPVLAAVLNPDPLDILAVELSSFQLHYTSTVSPLASCVLNVAADHLDWHGSPAAYAAAKARVYARTQVACVYNVQDEATEAMVAEAEVREGCRAIGFTVGIPDRSMVGMVEDMLADRAFVAQRASSAAELATVSDITHNGSGGEVAPHQVANALAAAAMARAAGVAPKAVGEGLRSFVPQQHRITEVGQVDGVRFIDDSKATNAHAAAASLAAYSDVVWVAGGQLKGADVEDVVAGAAPRLRGAVLLGADREQVARALARHAPQVPVVQVLTPETGQMTPAQRADAMDEVMEEVVASAMKLAQCQAVVLLAPAAASLDMFASYADRGRSFSGAVQRLGRRSQ